jgi:DNA-binding MarR family transcriptional regulator
MQLISDTSQDVAARLEPALVRLAHVLQREGGRGLSRTAASVLARLRDAGPQRVTALAGHESVAQPSMTALVARLERQGLVERRGDEADRRAVRVALTPLGRDVLRQRHAERVRALARRLGALDGKELAALVAAAPVLERLVDQEGTKA